MWTLRSDERLHAWKEFRHRLNDLPFDEAVAQTVHLWSFAPFVSHYLDRFEPEDWPSPWILLADNMYDDLAKSLGMLYTLYFTAHREKHSFALVKAVVGTSLENYNLVDIDGGKYILNFTFDTVISKVQLDKDLSVIHSYSANDLQLPKY